MSSRSARMIWTAHLIWVALLIWAVHQSQATNSWNVKRWLVGRRGSCFQIEPGAVQPALHVAALNVAFG